MATQISPSVLCAEKFHFEKSFIYGSVGWKVSFVRKFYLFETFICWNVLKQLGQVNVPSILKTGKKWESEGLKPSES